MHSTEIITRIKIKLPAFEGSLVIQNYADELTIKVAHQIFKDTCLVVHEIFSSAVLMLFATDERKERSSFEIKAIFIDFNNRQWIIVNTDIVQEDSCFDSLAKNMCSASLFEREIYEMFGIKPQGSLDLRRLHLHNEVWPEGNYPLRKDFKKTESDNLGEYKFAKVEGDGVFEVPVGPVHAGIIGPGHFRFSVAGEPIINLETRLGFTHRGVEKLFEGKNCFGVIDLCESVCGDSSFAHSLAFTQGVEKISKTLLPAKAIILRAIFLELERMYNHVNDIGGIAIDVGFSYPSTYASIIKEAILQLNEKITGNRYLKKVNTIGGVLIDINENKKQILLNSLKNIKNDFNELVKMLFASVSFMDRVDTTGVLRKKTAQDLGVMGVVGRASGISKDLRKYFPQIYNEVKFRVAIQDAGDVLARLKIRVFEFEESIRLIEEFIKKLKKDDPVKVNFEIKQGAALGYTEGWRGPVLYWIKIDAQGLIQRVKIVDASFLNWQGLVYAVLGNIIPDFPVCNKSFNLSYSGNDL